MAKCRTCGKGPSRNGKARTPYVTSRGSTVGPARRQPAKSKVFTPPKDSVKIKYVTKESGVDFNSIFREGKAILLVGNMQGCGVCRYSLKLLERISTEETRKHIKFYYVDRAILNPQLMTSIKNPTFMFVEGGKILLKEYGVISNLNQLVKEFIKGVIKSRPVKPF